MILESGSADEIPSVAFGKIFLCEPDWTIDKVSRKESQSLASALEFGFLNLTYQKEDSINNYDLMKDKIESLVKKFKQH